MSRSDTSGSYIKMTLGLVVVVAVVGYLFSDPFKSKVDRKIVQATQWTPENIQKDPEGYLFFAQGKIDGIKNALEAQLIEVAQRRERANNILIERASEYDAVSGLLQEMKEAYKEAQDSGVWPASVGDAAFTESDLRSRIIEAHARMRASGDQVDLIKATITQLGDREEKIRSQSAELETVARKIESDLEVVKTTKALEGFEEIQVDLAAFTSVSSLLADVPDGDSLDALIAERKQLASDEDFQAILREGD